MKTISIYFKLKEIDTSHGEEYLRIRTTQHK